MWPGRCFDFDRIDVLGRTSLYLKYHHYHQPISLASSDTPTDQDHDTNTTSYHLHFRSVSTLPFPFIMVLDSDPGCTASGRAEWPSISIDRGGLEDQNDASLFLLPSHFVPPFFVPHPSFLLPSLYSRSVSRSPSLSVSALGLSIAPMHGLVIMDHLAGAHADTVVVIFTYFHLLAYSFSLPSHNRRR